LVCSLDKGWLFVVEGGFLDFFVVVIVVVVVADSAVGLSLKCFNI